jgi:hypothetical protein
MRVLSKAFCRLKTTLPWVPADTKLSKLDTLRLATSYIAHLRAILTDEVAEVAPIHPLNLVSHELHPFHATHDISVKSFRHYRLDLFRVSENQCKVHISAISFNSYM